MEKRYVHADGSSFWVSSTATLGYADDGHADFVVATIEDISERRIAEHRDSLGLFSVEERLHLVGGTFHIGSAPGAGTRATVVLPG